MERVFIITHVCRARISKGRYRRNGALGIWKICRNGWRQRLAGQVSGRSVQDHHRLVRSEAQQMEQSHHYHDSGQCCLLRRTNLDVHKRQSQAPLADIAVHHSIEGIKFIYSSGPFLGSFDELYRMVLQLGIPSVSRDSSSRLNCRRHAPEAFRSREQYRD